MYRHVHVILSRTRNHSVYSHFLNTFTQKIIVRISWCAFSLLLCVLETSMWAEKDSPLHWTPTHARTHARTHTRMREGGGKAGRQGGRREGRQTGREAGRKGMFVAFRPWDCSKFILHPLADLFIPNPSRLRCCYIEDT